MTDIASLGYAIDSDQIKVATTRLDQMAAAADKAGDQAVSTTAQINAVGDAAQTTGQRMVTAAGQVDTMSAAMRTGGANVGNLAAQFNDIGMMLAAGQSPLMLALQQGTQVNQELDRMGSGANRVRALGAAFMSVISPANLLTIGIIAGGAALIQWAMSAMSAGDSAATFEDALDSLEEAISRVSEISQFYGEGAGQAMVDVYGAQNEAIREHIRLLDDVAQRNALAEIGAPVELLMSDLDGYFGTLESGIVELLGGVARGMSDFSDSFAGDAQQIAASLREASQATDVEGAITAYTRVRDLIISATGGIENMTSEQRQFFDRVVQSLDAVMRLRNESARPGWFSHAISQARILRDLVLETLESASRIPDSQYQMFLGYQAYYQSRADAPDSPVSRPGLDGGNGGGGADPMIAQIEALRDSLMTERETIDAWYAESQAILADRRAMEILGEQGHREALLDVEVEYQRRLAGIREEGGQSQLDQAATLFGELNTLAGGGYESLLRVQRSFAAASALINAYTAASQALADPSVPFFAKFAAVAKVLASGFGLVNAIKGGNKASGPSSASGMASTAPDQRVLIDVQGPDWAKDMIEGVLNQLYTQTKNGARPVFVS